jgi:putative transposase
MAWKPATVSSRFPKMSTVVHYVFSTYKRKQILDNEIASDLGTIFKNICKKKGLILICQSILLDHVHLLIRKDSQDKNEYVMKVIKGISSYTIFKKHPSNRFEFRKLWGRGYRAKEIKNEDQLMRTINYIDAQKSKGVDKRFIKTVQFRKQKVVGSRDV